MSPSPYYCQWRIDLANTDNNATFSQVYIQQKVYSAAHIIALCCRTKCVELMVFQFSEIFTVRFLQLMKQRCSTRYSYCSDLFE